MLQLIPEKLPCDHPCRFTISESSANVTTKSVIAEQIYPIMIPPTRRDAICCTFFDIRRINPVEISDPINAARISVYEENLPIYFKYTIIVSATTIFAPEEIPRTKGPAIGLEKNVCSKKPERDNAPPSNAAIRILGRRIFHIILYSVAAPSFRKRMLRILGTGI